METITKETNGNGELNAFTVLILTIGAFSSIGNALGEYFKYKEFHDQYLELFIIANILVVSIHVVSIWLILSKKNIFGLYLLIGNSFIMNFIVCPMIVFIANYPIFNISKTAILGITNIIVILLLLMLKSKGKSGYEVLSETKNNPSNSINVQSAALNIVYFLLLVVLVCSIVGIKQLL